MKARVIETNEIVDVRQAKPGDMYFIDDNNNNPYSCKELDFNVVQESSKEEEDDDDPIGLKKFILYKQSSKDDSYKEAQKAAMDMKIAEKDLEKEMMRFTFKCSLVSTLVSKNFSDSPQELMNIVEYYEKEIFDKPQSK